MLFTITAEAIDRLGVNPAARGREFSGWSTKEGLLGGVPRGILKWAKRELKVDRVDQIDSADARLAWLEAAESFEGVGAQHGAAQINALIASLPA
jgi:hypothetical protein